MSVSAAIAQHLAANDWGVPGVSLFVGGLRDGADVDDAAINVGRYDGNAIETYSAAEQQPFVQIMVRGAPLSFLAAETRADDLWSFLAAIRDLTVEDVIVDGINVGDVYIQCLRPLGTPLQLGEDESERPLVSMNFEVTR